MSNLNHCHPLRHDGTSRIARLVRALHPDAFRLDERTLQDLIVATHQYAQTLRYFDNTDQHPEGAYWEGFWEVEMLTYLAVVAAKDTDEIRRRYEEADAQFLRDLVARPAPGAKKTKISASASYRPLLEEIRLLALSLEEAYQKLVRIGHPLQNLLLSRIKRDNCCDPDELEGALTRLIGYHKGTPAPPAMADYAGFFGPDNRWGLLGRVDYDAVKANPNFSQNDLREIFITFFDSWLVLKAAAQENFEAEMARIELPEDVEYRIVQPHVVLFLVFLRLFRHAQDSLNELGTRHLNFYYEQVLGLRRRDEIPDDVYLLFELAKDVDKHLLEKGTEFLAGKDKNGDPLIFESLEDWVLRPAQVADLKNTHINTASGKITANPDVKKAYDAGAEKPNETADHWRSMGDDANLPNGEVGFAIASPQLILREGKRIVDVWLTVKNAPTLDWVGNPDLFQVYLSAEETWIKLVHRPDRIATPTAIPDLDRGAFNVFFDSAKKAIHVRAVLERDDPPVVQLGEKLAEEAGFDTQWPMMKVVINPALAVACPPDNPEWTTVEMYEALRALEIGDIVIKVDVRGIRENLIIQSDQGIFDGTQKVFPFGPVPEVGNRFYIGSTEVFQKALTTLKVCFEWIAPPENFVEHYAQYSMGSNDFSSPDPYLKIDFIDRADVSIPKQVVRFGKRTPNDGLSGIVSDLNGNPIPGIEVQLINTNGSPEQTAVTDADGKYTFLPGIDPAWTIQFIAPGQNDSNPGQSVLYETLELYADKDTPSAVPIKVGEFSTFNVVLFSKSVLFGALPANDLVTGTVHNIYGEAITADVVIRINGQAAVLSGGNFSFGAKGNSLAIEILAPANKYKVPNPGTVQLNGFSKIKIVLEPREKANQPNSAANINNTDPVISGIIRENKATGAAKAGAYAEAQAGNLTIAVFADSNGGYQLPLPTSNSNVRFFPNAYANGMVGPSSPLLPALTPSKTTVDADLIAVNQVEKKLVGDTISIRVKNYLNAPITSNLAFSIVRPGSTASVSPVLDNGIFRLPISANDRGNKLSVELSGFVPRVFTIGDYTEFEIRLLPLGNVHETGTAPAGTVTGSVFDANGTPLMGFTVEDDLATTGTVNGNTYAITPGSGASKIIFKKTGYQTTEYPNAPLAGKNINSILLPEVPTVAPVTDAITAKLVHANTSQASNVEVVLEGELNGRYIKYTTQTSADGSFAITRLAGVDLKKLTFVSQDNVTEIIPPPTAGDPLQAFFYQQVAKRRPARSTLIGTVRDIKGDAIKGATLVANIGGSTSTEVNGSFVLPLTNNGDFTVQIEHDAFRPLTVYVEQGCLEVNIRLVPLPISAVVSGKVTDVFDTPVGDVTINVLNTAIQTKSGSGGAYTIAIPFGVSPLLEMITVAGFEQKVVDLNAEFPVPGASFSKSEMNAILFYKSINYTALLDGQTVINTCFDVNINALNLVRDIRTQQFEKYSPTLKRGFVRFTLAEYDFLHDVYPKALSYYALSAPKEAHLLNPPYSPATNNISLDYTSEQIITAAANLGADNKPIDRYFHLLPFNGHKWLSLEKGELRLVYPYVPHDKTTEMSPYATGNLFIGISELQPGSALSLLLEMAHGTEAEPEKLPPLIVWSYLGPDNAWLPFGTGQIVRDDTRGLTRTGMIQFAVPTNAVRENTMLDPEFYWLRAAAVETIADESVHALPAITNIRAQVVHARFKNRNNALDHLAKPLPPETIAALVESRAEVKKVEQPLESFGGKSPESAGMEFYYRISERLRHKDRAVTVWDYEHLLLERFPDVAVAKCIQHTRYKPADMASELAPGYVTVAVVPDLRKRHGEPWAEPRFTQGDLNEMCDYLATKTNLFVAFGQKQEAHLQVVNPLYEKVDVQVYVTFRPEISDKVFYEEKLAEELAHYISPWLADPAAMPLFGRALERSQILQFIEERPYIDYVDVELYSSGKYKTFLIRTVQVNVAGQLLAANGNPLDETDASQKPVEILAADKVCPATARSILVAGSIAVNAALPDLAKCPGIPTNTGGDTTGGGDDGGTTAQVTSAQVSVRAVAKSPASAPAKPKAAKATTKKAAKTKK